MLNDRLGTMALSDAGVTADKTILISSMAADLLPDLGKESNKLVSFELALSSIFAHRQALNIKHLNL